MASSSRMVLRRLLLAKPSCGLAPIRATRFIRFSSTLQKDFENAKVRLGTLKEDPGNETKLQIYALFKQVSCWPKSSAHCEGGYDWTLNPSFHITFAVNRVWV